MKRSLPVRVFLILLFGVGLFAGPSPASELTISSRPQGSTVKLAGPVDVSGVTPFELPGPQGGRFRVTLLKPGFQTGVGWIEVNTGLPGASMSARSVVNVPDIALTLSGLAGPSKFVRGERRKGFILSIAQAAGIVGASIKEWRAMDYREKYEDAMSKYVSAQSEEEAARYHAEAVHNYEVRKNALAGRDACLIATAVPALYNLVENLLLDRRGAPMVVGADELTFGLRPVNMPSAMLRGILFPGMGHVYAGHETMGTVWSVSVMSAAAAALIAESYYMGRRLDYDEALSEYQSADTEGAADLARRQLEDEFESMEDAYRLKRVLGGVAVGLWVLSIIDAGRVSTIWSGESESLGKRSFSMNVSGVANGVQIVLTVPFG